MSDYISREETLKAIQPRYAPAINKVLAGIIESVPAADVKPVVHGEWVLGNESWGKIVCSNCRCEALLESSSISSNMLYAESTYCPHCGAEMGDTPE